MISFRAGLFFNDEMTDFEDWVFYLSEHASDADWRKSSDPEEGPKHYIDIDNYSVFESEGAIPQSLTECETTFGKEFVKDNGYLPWATISSYDSLVSALKKEDWNKAKIFAADLGHYVADGHMPLHLTRNYNGQFTGNTGIHSRYEIDMINTYQDKITYEGSPATVAENVSDYIFSYIYENYAYMDSLLIADDYAKEMAESGSSDLYYAALWEKTEHLTVLMFEKASKALADLIYTAWLEAGKPSKSINTSTRLDSEGEKKVQISPNPVHSSFNVRLNQEFDGKPHAFICDLTGRKVEVKIDFFWNATEKELTWDASSLKNGIHFFQIQDQDRHIHIPFLVLH